MRAARLLLVFLLVVSLASNKVCFSQEEAEVVVYGASDISPAEETSASSESEESYDPELVMPIEITGSRFGDSVVSEAVTFSEEREIIHAEVTMGQGITIIRVDKNGDEHQVFGFDRPGQAIGKKLSPGSYKVYPDNLNRGSEISKITATISVEPVSIDRGEGE